MSWKYRWGSNARRQGYVYNPSSCFYKLLTCKQGRVKIIQLRVPVQVFSGIIPTQNLAIEKNYSLQTSTLDLSLKRDDLLTRGPSHQHESSIVRPVSRMSQENISASPHLDYGSPPPTYAHAILTSVNDGLRREESMPQGRMW
jgi:hypothetical protein